jgi:hypothetical protein
VVSIMVGKAVNKYSNIVASGQGMNRTDLLPHHDQSHPGEYSPIEIATLICFIVGVMQVRMESFDATWNLILFLKAADVCSPSWDPIIPSIRMSSVRLHDRLCRPCFYISGQRPSWTRNPKGQRIFQSYKGRMFVTSLISD